MLLVLLYCRLELLCSYCHRFLETALVPGIPSGSYVRSSESREESLASQRGRLYLTPRSAIAHPEYLRVIPSTWAMDTAARFNSTLYASVKPLGRCTAREII